MADEKKNDISVLEPAEVIDEANVIKLKKPLENGVDRVVFNWDKVTGFILTKCYERAKKKEPAMTIPSTSMVYQAAVAAAASGLRYDDILSLSGSDFIAVTIKVQSFLLDTGN